jgi:hypothetical protein
MRKIHLIVILGVFLCRFVNAQTDILAVEKRTDLVRDSFYGSKLVLLCRTDTGQEVSFTYSYDLAYFITLDNEKKLKLIGELLKYENDTSLCCLEVANYSFGNEGCRGHPPDVTRYTTQIDALFMINRLCWPKLMELYSCSPVLYDKRRGKAINDDQAKIKLVFAKYKKWYATCMSKGRLLRYFPFNEGRYSWFGGRKSIARK